MSTSTAELTLIMRAQNFADAEMAKLRSGLDTIRDKAATITTAFVTAARAISRELTNVLINVLNGQDIGVAAASAGIMMAGSLVAHFGETLITRLASSAFIQGIAATLAGLGTSIGAFVAAAIPIGMAALPFLLIAALIAAAIYLVNNPKVGAQIREIGGNVVAWIINGLATLAGAILGVFAGAFNVVARVVSGIVGGIIDRILGIVRAVTNAIASLNLLREHTPQQAADYHQYGTVPGKASGGWVGMNGPELSWLGEKGPEYVVPNHQLGDLGAGHGHDIILDGQRVATTVGARLYRDAQRFPARS